MGMPVVLHMRMNIMIMMMLTMVMIMIKMMLHNGVRHFLLGTQAHTVCREVRFSMSARGGCGQEVQIIYGH